MNKRYYICRFTPSESGPPINIQGYTIFNTSPIEFNCSTPVFDSGLVGGESETISISIYYSNQLIPIALSNSNSDTTVYDCTTKITCEVKKKKEFIYFF